MLKAHLGYNKKWSGVWAVTVCLLLMLPSIAVAEETPALDASLKPILPLVRADVQAGLDFCGEPVPFDLDQVRERFEKEMMLTLWNRPQVILWLKRTSRYLPLIEEMLRAEGVPDDLKFIPIVESALRAHAGSRKGAIGYWQFLSTTGRRYGLTINRYIDERRNIRTSTRAAIQYLKDLQNQFGTWTMAAAGYNMGEEGLEAEVLVQETQDYYNLYLPLETQRFVFRILAVKLIFSDPERYTFTMLPQDYYQPLLAEEVQLDVFQEIPIQLVARAAETEFKTIKDFNPELRGHYLRPGNYTLYIPQGNADGFDNRFRTLAADYQERRQERIYVVKEGDNLSLIAERFRVPLAALLIWNRLNLKQPIHPGDRLIIYPAGDQSEN